MKDAATLLLKSGTSTSWPKVVCVEFNPPFPSYEEVKARLLGMKVDADEALSTVRPKSPFDSLPQFLKPHPPPSSISHKSLLTYKSSLRIHVFRTTIPYLDHGIPPLLIDLHL